MYVIYNDYERVMLNRDDGEKVTAEAERTAISILPDGEGEPFAESNKMMIVIGYV